MLCVWIHICMSDFGLDCNQFYLTGIATLPSAIPAANTPQKLAVDQTKKTKENKGKQRRNEKERTKGNRTAATDRGNSPSLQDFTLGPTTPAYLPFPERKDNLAWVYL